jgi:uroporphyrin-III C-methyltransferase
MTGRVLLVGAGPGAADLLTIRARNALDQATVVLYDRLVGSEILRLVPPTAEVIDVGKTPGADHTQALILELMGTLAIAGHVVVRLKGGDPMVFGRGGEELTYLAERGIPAEVVPGITSAIGVPTSIGLPLTLRHLASGFAVVAGATLQADSAARYASADTLVILMGAKARVRIAKHLIGAGRPAEDPVAFIESGTTAEQRVTVTTLGEVAAGNVDANAPVVWVCGPVVNTLSSSLLPQPAVAIITGS